jgi:hypothetical protein
LALKGATLEKLSGIYDFTTQAAGAPRIATINFIESSSTEIFEVPVVHPNYESFAAPRTSSKTER